MNFDIFRAYDIRGIYGVDFQPKHFYEIASAYAALFQPKTVALGHDVRESSPHLWQQVADALQNAGVDILNLGQISTDMLYFAAAHYKTDGGIVISASHNPAAYNGMKIVGQQGSPLCEDTGLLALRDVVANGREFVQEERGNRGGSHSLSFYDAYLGHIRSFVNPEVLDRKRIVINANNGLSGQIAERLLEGTPIEICEGLFTEPDGRFSNIPGGRPDPLRPENRRLTTLAVKRTGADLAVAWDADADRCFFFDENGQFVEGCYITALLAGKLLAEQGRGIVIFDPRAIWAVENAVLRANGIPCLNRCGHSFIKTRMRKTNALFAGEASGHYYFKDNFCMDNGMIPFLMVLEYLSECGKSLAESVAGLRSAYPVSGEINFSFETPDQMQEVLNAVRHKLDSWGKHPCIETPIDGLSVRFLANFRSFVDNRSAENSWRLNLRASNTEPLLRLNVESLGSQELLIEQTTRITEQIQRIGGKRETRFRWEEMPIT